MYMSLLTLLPKMHCSKIYDGRVDFKNYRAGAVLCFKVDLFEVDERVIMKGCVQQIPVYDSKYNHLKRMSSPDR